jgi:hypothetical protein
LEIGDQMRESGPDPHVSDAQERLEAATISFGVYSAAEERDQHLAWGAAVLWLAFGFAAALAAQHKDVLVTA